MGKEEMKSCFIIPNAFLSWFSCCSWKRIMLINNIHHLHLPSHLWLATLLLISLGKQVARELPHFPTTRSTHLHLNPYSSSKDNLFALCFGPHTFSLSYTLWPSIIYLTVVPLIPDMLFLLLYRHTKLIFLLGLCTLSYLGSKLFLRYS